MEHTQKLSPENSSTPDAARHKGTKHKEEEEKAEIVLLVFFSLYQFTLYVYLDLLVSELQTFFVCVICWLSYNLHSERQMHG